MMVNRILFETIIDNLVYLGWHRLLKIVKLVVQTLVIFLLSSSNFSFIDTPSPFDLFVKFFNHHLKSHIDPLKVFAF